MAGSATLTTVASSTTRPEPSTVTNRTHRPACERCRTHMAASSLPKPGHGLRSLAEFSPDPRRRPARSPHKAGRRDGHDDTFTAEGRAPRCAEVRAGRCSCLGASWRLRLTLRLPPARALAVVGLLHLEPLQ